MFRTYLCPQPIEARARQRQPFKYFEFDARRQSAALDRAVPMDCRLQAPIIAPHVDLSPPGMRDLLWLVRHWFDGRPGLQE
jgi:hypothetical protein